MNYNIWLLFEEFQSLSIGGKIVVVAWHILAILCLMLWEESKAQKHDARESSTATPNSLIEYTEKLVHTNKNPHERGNPHKRSCGGIMNTLRNSWIQAHLYCKANKKGDRSIYQFRSHIRTIVNWLRRGVNQSGKEPIEQ